MERAQKEGSSSGLQVMKNDTLRDYYNLHRNYLGVTEIADLEPRCNTTI
jgi:hypothetical protein